MLWAAELIRHPREGFKVTVGERRPPSPREDSRTAFKMEGVGRPSRLAESSQLPSTSALPDARASRSGAELRDEVVTLVLLITYIMVLFKLAIVTL